MVEIRQKMYFYKFEQYFTFLEIQFQKNYQFRCFCEFIDQRKAIQIVFKKNSRTNATFVNKKVCLAYKKLTRTFLGVCKI